MVERDDKLRALQDMLAGSVEGKGAIAVVNGPLASGKTELLEAFAEHARESGALVLSATGSPTEHPLPFGVMGQLFQRAPLTQRHWEALSEALGTDRCIALLSESAQESERALEQVYAPVMHHLWAILCDLSARQPVVITVDDMQYVDSFSLRGLLFLALRTRTAPVLMVLSEYDGERLIDPLLHSELLRQPHSRRVRLSPLTMDGVARVLAERLGEGGAGAPVSDYYEATGGNPLLLNALIDDQDGGAGHPARGDRTRGPVPGEAFDEAVLICLRRRDSRLLPVATAIAVLGDHGSPALIAPLLGIDTASAVHGVRALDVAGITADGRFRHPAARDAVLDNTPPQERAALHRLAAVLLREDGAPGDTVAGHLLRAGRDLPAWAGDVLHEAGSQALRRDELDLATEYLEHAYRASSDPRQQAVIMTLLTSTEWRVDPSTAARHFERLTTAVREGHLHQPHTITVIRYLLWHGRVAEAGELLERVVRSAGSPAPEAAGEIRFLRLWLTYCYPGVLPWAPAALAALAGDDPGPAKAAEPYARVVGLLEKTLVQGRADSVVVEAEKILHNHGLSDTNLEPLTNVLRALLYADRPDAAARWCESLLVEAGARNAPAWQAVLLNIRGETALRLGFLPAAARDTRLALTHMSPEKWGTGIGGPLSVLLTATTAMGRLEEAADLLTEPVPEPMFQTQFGLHYWRARGHYFLATDRLHAALEDFQACGELMATWGIDLPGIVPWRTDLAQVWLRMGKPERAKALITEQLAMTGGSQNRLRGTSLRLLAATGDLKERPRLLGEAIEALHACGDRRELAHALKDLSDAHHRLGEPERARMLMRRAWHLAKQCGSALLREDTVPAPRTALEHGTVPVADVTGTAGPTGTAVLSEAERRVAALAAEGHTNRQIARKLYITVSTVEQHLTRAYRKLNVNRRTDLPADLSLITIDRA
ncbi:AAA family ATPase [Streptomyces sp. UNOB3_S3]|nr:AAA family ATPase [Streptomyces sp. UNOB3_S3]